MFDDENYGDAAFLTEQLVQEAVTLVAHARLTPSRGRENVLDRQPPITASAHSISVPQTQARRFLNVSAWLGSCGSSG